MLQSRIEQAFLLQDSRSHTGDGLMFWALGGGYTTNIDQAERFTQDQAQRQHECRETDIPWPAAYIEQRAHRGVDCQYVSQKEAAPLLAQGGPVLFQVPKRWNGNDLIWWQDDDDYSPFVDAALRATEERTLSAGRDQGFIAWPLLYIEGKTRRLVYRQNVKLDQALHDTSIVLQKPRKPKADRYNCEGCGRFISERQRYLQDCPNCGQDNRM
ncbi:hypothetical protein BJP27_24225 (plasmid) [Pseudomonas oryzihabitans]|nr:hypothetical protein BJP27_24225 [Pseudomonas psychrotolerans]